MKKAKSEYIPKRNPGSEWKDQYPDQIDPRDKLITIRTFQILTYQIGHHYPAQPRGQDLLLQQSV